MSSTTLTRFPRTKAEERNIAAGKPPFSGAIYFGRCIGWGQKLSATQRRQLAGEVRERDMAHFAGSSLTVRVSEDNLRRREQERRFAEARRAAEGRDWRQAA